MNPMRKMIPNASPAFAPPDIPPLEAGVNEIEGEFEAFAAAPSTPVGVEPMGVDVKPSAVEPCALGLELGSDLRLELEGLTLDVSACVGVGLS